MSDVSGAAFPGLARLGVDAGENATRQRNVGPLDGVVSTFSAAEKQPGKSGTTTLQAWDPSVLFQSIFGRPVSRTGCLGI